MRPQLKVKSDRLEKPGIELVKVLRLFTTLRGSYLDIVFLLQNHRQSGEKGGLQLESFE